ncbi:MAG: carboxypeptidase M32 [Alphaproteobacteria bacterium]|nr:carboxypeptidase M32 [Alphaproteobacteria bacterium]
MTDGPYAALEARFRRIAIIDGAQAVLHWDRAVMMPPGGADARTEQLAVLSGLSHELIVEPAIGDLLDRVEADRDRLGPWQAANLREMRRLWRHANALSQDLVEALARAASTCELNWRQARAADDFASVLPSLENLIGLVREKAQAKATALDVPPYEALLDAYDPGRRRAEIDRLFAELRSFLPSILSAVLARQSRRSAPMPFDGPLPIEAQRRLGEALMTAVGFDTEFGRLDVSHHPFTGGVPDDVRITTRYKDDDFSESVMAVLHETGHALYERGLPAAWRWQPVGESRGMTIHESQSLLIEMQACRGRQFSEFALPIIKSSFGKSGPAWTLENLLAHTQRVEPGLIRVEADEVTYPFHVMLRYDLETALLQGDLRPRDLPGAWRDGMMKLLGIAVPDDRDGCMQDIHWFHGDIGYFPTYTLGALAAAQLFAAAVAAVPDIPERIRRGDFRPLLGWLREHVHGVGCLSSSDDLLERATGTGLGTEAFRRHVERRYLS